MDTSIIQHFCFFIFVILRPSFVSCRSGYVSEVVPESKFYCDASKMNVFKTASEMQCVHKCASFENCQLLNYGVAVKEQENCEIFLLPHNHKSCKMLKDETNWKSLVFQAVCHDWKFNYCFPCICQSTCLRNENICQCDTVSTLPYIFISFEEIENATSISYTRGTDKNGNSLVELKNGAKVVGSRERVGNVLSINGFQAGAVVGDFPSHPLNNPNTGKSTWTFWLKVISGPTTPQTIVGTGRKLDNTGILLRISDHGRRILAECIISNTYVTLQYDVGETLLSWTHIAMVEYANSGPSIKLYINGILVHKATGTVSQSADTAKFTSLVIGADEELSPFTSEKYEVHLDDFAIWLTSLSAAEITYIATQKYNTCVH